MSIEQIQKEAAKRESDSNKELWTKYESAPVVDAISLDRKTYDAVKKITTITGESMQSYFARAVGGMVQLDLDTTVSELQTLAKPARPQTNRKAAENVQKCAMCGAMEFSIATVTYTDDNKEDVPVCNSCGHYHFADAEYVYVIRGLAKNWASVSDLKGTLEDILGQWLLPVDRRGLVVEIAEMG